ncbi:AraC-like DNA-binding protein [Marisediminicola sp. UYEF4]|uniref:helix-turn-helix domain-containing protein n=1 Tax=Marisediminicola sp. UYEF4 TaxID=1756384 RepID=UPI003394033A
MTEWSPLEYLERKPSGALDTIAERLWYLRAPSPQQFERILPLPFVHLIINLSDPYTVRQLDGASVAQRVEGAFIAGIQHTVLVNENPAVLRHVAIRLRPSGLIALTGRSVGHDVVDAEPLIPGITALRASILHASSAVDALDQLETQLRAWIRPGWSLHPALERALRMIDGDPNLRIAEVARAVGISGKSLIDLFTMHCGITPKRYSEVARLHRFVNSIPSLAPIPTWTELAAETGYYDQPHFIRTFTRFTGQTPQRYLESVRSTVGAAPSFLPTGSIETG